MTTPRTCLRCQKQFTSAKPKATHRICETCADINRRVVSYAAASTPNKERRTLGKAEY